MKLKLYLFLLAFSSQFMFFGQQGTHLNFDGINDYVALSATPANIPLGNSSYTIEAWINSSELGAKGIVGWGDYGTTNKTNALRLAPNGVYNYWWNADLFVPFTFNLNTWYHIAATYDGTTRSIYINGALIGSDTPPTNSHNITNISNVTIGRTSNSEYFKGNIDEVRIWNVARTAGEINNSKNLELVGNETGLVSYYNFNQGINAGNNIAVTAAIDATGTNNGTVTNFTLTGATSNWISGPAASHLNFDGVNDYVTLPNESNFDFTNQMSVEFWMNSNVANPDQWDALVVKGDDSWRVHLNATGTVYFTCSAGASTLNAISTTIVTDGNWHHIAATLGGNSAKIYIDGVLENQVAVPGILNNSTYPVLIGNNPVFGPRYYTGNLDDVRIWNTTRTAEQINGSKNCELQATETGLVAYYKFNQGANAGKNFTVTTLTDATTNANIGTLINFTLLGSTSNWLAGSPVTTGSIVPSNATVTTPVTYNQGATASALTATTGANGTGLLWYTAATGGTGSATAPTPSTATAGNTSYWVSSTNANGCESARMEIVVTVNAAATHLNFDGVNDYVNCGNILPASYTKEAWISINSTSLNNNIISGSDAIGQNAFWAPAGRLAAGHNGNWTAVQDASTLALNTWYHVAVSYDSATQTLNLYKNGILIATATGVPAPINGNLVHIGCFNPGSNVFRGNIDEVRIWNRALPIAEIQNNMNCELPSPTTQNGLIAYYQFNQGFNAVTNTGVTTLADASGNSNTGTLTNFALTGATSNWLAGSPIVTGTNCTTFLSSSSFDVSENINVYPNPTNGNVNIMVNSLTNVSVSVYDLNGRQILNKELSANENAVDISNFQTGMYLFRIKSSEGEVVKKVIKN